MEVQEYKKRGEIMKYKIGQEIVIDENYEIYSSFTDDVIPVEIGDKGFLDANGNIHYTKGKAKGRISPFTEKENLERFDTRNIANIVLQELEVEFKISDFIEEYGVDKEYFLDFLENGLMEVLF